jgi:hypothetical protein
MTGSVILFILGSRVALILWLSIRRSSKMGIVALLPLGLFCALAWVWAIPTIVVLNVLAIGGSGALRHRLQTLRISWW